MVPKVLYLLLIACIFGTVIQMSFADSSNSSESSESSESSDSSDSSDSSVSSASSESEEKPVVKPVEDKDDRKPQKPPTKAEEAENKTVVKKLEIVLPTIPVISPVPGLKPNVDKAKDLVAQRLNNGGSFVNAVANSIRQAVHAAKPVLAITKLINEVVKTFAEVASLNPIAIGVRILQEGLKIGMSILTASLPLMITGTITIGN